MKPVVMGVVVTAPRKVPKLDFNGAQQTKTERKKLFSHTNQRNLTLSSDSLKYIFPASNRDVLDLR